MVRRKSIFLSSGFSLFEGLDDWDFVGLGDFNANIRWFNVDSRSIIATVNQTAGKAASALNKAISIYLRKYFEEEKTFDSL